MPLNSENICCPICESSAVKVRHQVAYDAEPKVAGVDFCVSHDAKIMECDRCSFRFTHPLPDFELINECYRKADSDVWKDGPFNEVRRRFPQMIGSLAKNNPPDESVLDIGCYAGSFLNEFPGNWSLYGVEPGGKAAEIARGRGVEIITDRWEDLDSLGREFGCVVSLSVIEHIPNPSIFVDSMISVVKQGGLLLIETGDYSSFFPKLMGRFWRYYNLPEHVSFFSAKGLSDLLQRKGLEIVEVKRGLFHKRPYGVKQWIVFVMRFARLIGLRALSRMSLYKLGESPSSVAFAFDHVCIIARKKKDFQR